ncbi:MAG: hypothetical protein ACI83H_001611 [Glaciecola sp.]|jgi:hypothetical protein
MIFRLPQIKVFVHHKTRVLWLQTSWGLYCFWVFQSIDITKASVHDVHLLKDLKYQMSDCVLLGDGDYLSSTLQLDLFETANIKLETPMRTNQIGY